MRNMLKEEWQPFSMTSSLLVHISVGVARVRARNRENMLRRERVEQEVH